MANRRMARRNVGRSKPYKKIQQAGCHPDRRTVPFREGSIVSLKEPCLGCASDQDVCENRCRYLTYSDWRKIPKEGHENGPCIDESDTGDRATRSRAMQGMD